jgi:PAS domain S-box-containing protein
MLFLHRITLIPDPARNFRSPCGGASRGGAILARSGAASGFLLTDVKGIHDMVEKPDFSRSAGSDGQSPAPDEWDVWAQLAEFASRADADPVLRMLVDEATANHRNLRGITATIANRYRAMIDAVPDAITIHDESGRTLDANETACRLFARERNALLGSSIQDLFPDLDADFLRHLCEAFEDDDASMTRTCTIDGDGPNPGTLELHAQTYLDARQKRIIAVTRNLGPRELAAQQLHRSEAELRQLMHDMDKGVVVRNRKGQIISSNPAACRILQMSEADLLALGADQLCDWHYVDEAGRPIRYEDLPWSRAIASGKAIESSIYGLSSSGIDDLRWLSIAAVPRFGNAPADAEQVVSIFADITPIKQEASLFAHAQSLTSLGAWQLLAGSERMIWSTHMHSIFDVPVTTPISRERMLDHFSGLDQRRFRNALESARTEETTEITARITTAIGRRRQVRIRVRALDRENTTGDVIGCVQDITAETANNAAFETD